MTLKAKSLPLVSVIMPNFNGDKYIFDAITSILEQSFNDFELIIIDDGSTDRSVEIIKSFSDQRIILVRGEENLGIVRRLNEGADLAQGAYIARMDSDDIAHPERFQRQVEILETSHVAFVGCNYSVIDAVGSRVRDVILPETSQQIYMAFPRRCPFVHGSVMFKRNLFFKAGGYQVSPVEDYHLWLRFAREHVEFYNIQEVLYSYRVHVNSLSSRSHLEMVRSAMTLQFSVVPLLHLPKLSVNSVKQAFILDFIYRSLVFYPSIYKAFLFSSFMLRTFYYFLCKNFRK